MNSFRDLEWFKSAFGKYGEDVRDSTDWKALKGSAIYRKHTGDIQGAIDAMVKSIDFTKSVPELANESAMNLNFLADLYMLGNAFEKAETTLRESIALARPNFPVLLADNLLGLGAILSQKGCYVNALVSAEEALDLYQQQGLSHGIIQAEQLIRNINGRPPDNS